ncbi:MAG: hypothetical protein PF517_14385 [Salinivirgaceae bacterium]|jgi:hypothetical protein|nr:hypothetical protein [Salinivirgaceae bacterium]
MIVYKAIARKRLKFIFFFLLGIFSLSQTYLQAQESSLFMPREIKTAYKNGTRSFDGKPGEKYWQNSVDYEIKVSIVPHEQLIVGNEEVVFHNESPNENNTLVVRLYGDVYKKGFIRGREVNGDDLNDGVELQDISINGNVYDLQNQKLVKRVGTNLYIELIEPLKPNSSLLFKASWKQKIPSVANSRMGVYDTTSFFVGQWYPQISVYDDIFGWDKLDYTLVNEFYNNLANFNV